ncbi:MAG: SulP family inorganic anion transporter [archaeon]
MNVKSYFKEAFVFDLKAGFITSIVALPLAIAFAVASGVSPIMGLYTAVIAGALGSLFGGSAFSITGPTGAMAVIILSSVQKYGIEGLMLAGFLAGAIQIIFGLIGLGEFVKFIPLPVVSGFTSGIGILIFLGQIPNFLGLSIPAKEAAYQTVIESIININSVKLHAVIIAVATYLCLYFLPRIFAKIKLNIPPSIIPLILSLSVVYFYKINIPIIGTIPSGLPTFNMVSFNLSLLQSVFPAAVTIALLGSIEALLCAVVCDGMTNTKHDSKKELIGQGIANSVLPFFGGIASTAAIARSAVNIKEGAKTKFAGVIHALFILLYILVLGSFVSYIPKAFLAGMLVFYSIRMVNIHEMKTIIKISKAETVVLFITLGMTVFTDLVHAVQIGMILAIMLFFIRFVSLFNISSMEDYEPDKGLNAVINSSSKLKKNVSVYTIHGPFFFGAMSVFERKINEHIDASKPIVILMMYNSPFIDTSGVTRLLDFIKERHNKNGYVLLVGLTSAAKQKLFSDEEFSKTMPHEHIFKKASDAITYAEKNLFYNGTDKIKKYRNNKIKQNKNIK